MPMESKHLAELAAELRSAGYKVNPPQMPIYEATWFAERHEENTGHQTKVGDPEETIYCIDCSWKIWSAT